MSHIHILADDLTGALDCAAAFAGRVPVYLDRPPSCDAVTNGTLVAVVATPSRDVSIDALPGMLAPVLDWFTSAELSFKKVDSLLRGNTFAEIGWLAQHGVFQHTVFAPAYPAQGRITLNNRHWVQGATGERQLVAEDLSDRFTQVGFRCQGPLGNSALTPSVWVPEVQTQADLEAIAAQASVANGPKRLWCGSAGLGHALARQFKLAAADAPFLPLLRTSGPTVLVSASFQPTLHAQWSLLRAAEPQALFAQQANAQQITQVLAQLAAGAQTACFDLSPPTRLTAQEAAEALHLHIAQLSDQLPRPGQLAVIGGDTLLALCRATGAQALLAQAPVRPGWGCAQLCGGRWDGVFCHSRSGAFGAPDDLQHMFRLLHSNPVTKKGS